MAFFWQFRGQNVERMTLADLARSRSARQRQQRRALAVARADTRRARLVALQDRHDREMASRRVRRGCG